LVREIKDGAFVVVEEMRLEGGESHSVRDSAYGRGRLRELYHFICFNRY
jgi:hypothetical protein